ncbi:MAG: amidohydrolase family protein [Clostridiales bacterium]|nr:amidohydrolase family protein [Clostridiales bacterium]
MKTNNSRPRKTTAILTALIMLLSVFGVGSSLALAAEDEADTVWVNGKIYTLDGDMMTGGMGTVASIIAVKGQKIVYVGSDMSVADKYVANGAKKVDLGGNVVIPGLHDSHMHFTMEGQMLVNIDIFQKPKQDILDTVKAERDRLKAQGADPKATWIVSGGWLQTMPGWPTTASGGDIMPSRQDLDAVVSDYPVVLQHASGHARWANTMAIELAGMDPENPPKEFGNIPGFLDEKGHMTGYMAGDSNGAIGNAVPEQTEQQLIDALYAAQDECFSYGITSAMDAGSGVDTINLLKKQYETGKFKIRIYQEVSGPDGDLEGGNTKPNVNAVKSTGDDIKFRAQNNNKPLLGAYGDRLTIRTCKIFLDGAQGSRTAFQIDPYSDYDPKTMSGSPNGLQYFSDEALDEVMYRNISNGFQVSAHVIGNGANKQYIDSYERVKERLIKEGKADLVADTRIRSEHFQNVRDVDIKRAADLGMIQSMQFVHATSDMWSAEARLGPERILGGYAWRKVLDAGGIIANGTDAAVELLNPYHGLFAAVTRQFRKEYRDEVGYASPKGAGTPGGDGGWYVEQCLDRAEALRAYTIWGAYAEFAEDIKGTLEVGRLADFVVIDRDYFDEKACPDRDIEFIEAVMTVLGGEVVYGALETAAPELIARPTAATVLVNGENVSFDAYNIEGNNYFKLRDLAYVLSDSDKPFEVEFNQAENAIYLTSGEEYTAIGGEMSGKGEGNKTPLPTKQVIFLDEEEVSFTAYNIEGNNYFKLRDIGEAFDFGVDWDDASKTISIDTAKGYTPE